MQKFLSTNSTADYLGYSTATLRNSRNTKTLAGVAAPAYIKTGRSIRYDIETLNKWMAQFSTLSNTKNELS